MIKPSLAFAIEKKIRKDKIFESFYNVFDATRQEIGLDYVDSLDFLIKTLEKGKQKKGLISALIPLFNKLKETYSLDDKELTSVLLNEIGRRYRVSKKSIRRLIKSEIFVPLSIFSADIGVLEVVVKYLHENERLTFSEIAEALSRDPRTIWTAYKTACEKRKGLLKVPREDKFVLIRELTRENLTVLESLVLYLRNSGMRFCEIGDLICRDQRNIWSVYSRANKKMKGGKNE